MYGAFCLTLQGICLGVVVLFTEVLSGATEVICSVTVVFGCVLGIKNWFWSLFCCFSAWWDLFTFQCFHIS